MKKLLTAITLIILLLCAACSTSRRAAADGDTVDTPDAHSAATPFEALTATYADWTDISVPIKVNIVSPKRLSVSGTLKMVRGSSINISLRMLGFEVGSLYADADSLIITAKPADAYVCESMGALKRYYGLDITDLQSLILGRLFYPGKGQASAGDASLFSVEAVADSPGTFTLVPAKLPAGAAMVFTADSPADAMPGLSALSLSATAAPTIACSFGPAEESSCGVVASSLDFHTAIAAKELQAAITLSIDRAAWNSGTATAKPNVARYANRIKGADLLRILSKF